MCAVQCANWHSCSSFVSLLPHSLSHTCTHAHNMHSQTMSNHYWVTLLPEGKIGSTRRAVEALRACWPIALTAAHVLCVPIPCAPLCSHGIRALKMWSTLQRRNRQMVRFFFHHATTSWFGFDSFCSRTSHFQYLKYFHSTMYWAACTVVSIVASQQENILGLALGLSLWRLHDLLVTMWVFFPRHPKTSIQG